ncbi:hypothetical protein [Leifsonia sp. fls2-241-R2A-40a]|nr:hypothetical protein [Leifsonia sp. fls2-241-R2A-40a]
MTASVTAETMQNHPHREPRHDPLWAPLAGVPDGLDAVILGYD